MFGFFVILAVVITVPLFLFGAFVVHGRKGRRRMMRAVETTARPAVEEAEVVVHPSAAAAAGSVELTDVTAIAHDGEEGGSGRARMVFKNENPT